MWKKFLQKEICLIYSENISLILDGTVLKINIRARNVKNHLFLRGSQVSKIAHFAASFSASSQVTSETKHFFQLCVIYCWKAYSTSDKDVYISKSGIRLLGAGQ